MRTKVEVAAVGTGTGHFRNFGDTMAGIFNKKTVYQSITALFVAMAVAGCNTHPSKYKRKGCDCPKWGMERSPGEHGQHAIFGVAPANKPHRTGKTA